MKLALIFFFIFVLIIIAFIFFLIKRHAATTVREQKPVELSREEKIATRTIEILLSIFYQRQKYPQQVEGLTDALTDFEEKVDLIRKNKFNQLIFEVSPVIRPFKYATQISLYDNDKLNELYTSLKQAGERLGSNSLEGSGVYAEMHDGNLHIVPFSQYKHAIHLFEFYMFFSSELDSISEERSMEFLLEFYEQITFRIKKFAPTFDDRAVSVGGETIEKTIADLRSIYSQMEVMEKGADYILLSLSDGSQARYEFIPEIITRQSFGFQV